jgi:hypothetical protein
MAFADGLPHELHRLTSHLREFFHDLGIRLSPLLCHGIGHLQRRQESQHRQASLGAIQCLNLALFVEAEHERMIGRVQIEPLHITSSSFSMKSGSLDTLKVLMRCGLRQLHCVACVGARCVVAIISASLARGKRLETPPTRTVVIQRVHAACGEALSPIQHGRTRRLECLGQRRSVSQHTVSSMLPSLAVPRARLAWCLGGFVTNSRE